jgi:hypothetical protein
MVSLLRLLRLSCFDPREIHPVEQRLIDRSQRLLRAAHVRLDQRHPSQRHALRQPK